MVLCSPGKQKGRTQMSFRDFLDNRGLTVRGFARLMAEADHDMSHTNFERWRQNAYRWQRGASISPDLARTVADNLGVQPAELLKINSDDSRMVVAKRLDRLEAMLVDLAEVVERLVNDRAGSNRI